jgi:purine nucleoside permease
VAEWVVDGSAANLIDPRELPSDWLYPFFHLGCGVPWCGNGFTTGTEVYHLDQAMTARAFELTEGVALADSADAKAYRATFSDAPAIATPRVIRGDCVASPSLPSGHILSDYMAWWMRQWSGGKGTYVMSSAEDIGTLTALRRLADAGRVDWRRVMLLRTGSDFDRGAPGQSALDAIQVSGKGGLPIAYDIALENAHRVGSAVTNHIFGDWERWRGGPPA